MLWMWIAIGAGIATMVLSWRTRIHPAAYACIVPIIAAVIMFFILLMFRPGNSTAPGAVPLLLLFAAGGSIPGAFIGGWLRGRSGNPVS